MIIWDTPFSSYQYPMVDHTPFWYSHGPLNSYSSYCICPHCILEFLIDTLDINPQPGGLKRVQSYICTHCWAEHNTGLIASAQFMSDSTLMPLPSPDSVDISNRTWISHLAEKKKIKDETRIPHLLPHGFTVRCSPHQKGRRKYFTNLRTNTTSFTEQLPVHVTQAPIKSRFFFCFFFFI